jgi:hypothetical protein
MRIASPTARTRCFAAALVLALLFAQALGFVHRSVHGIAPADAAASSGALAQSAPPNAQHDGWTHLFAHDDGGAECRLFDAVGYDALQPGLLALPAAIPPAAVLAVLAGESLARWAAMFDARGPPPAR